MTQAELIAYYKSLGGKTDTNEDKDAFNKWADNLAYSQGVDSWDKIQSPGSNNQNPFYDPSVAAATGQGGSNLNNAIDNALTQGAIASQIPGNTRQVQGGNQHGEFSSEGTQGQTQVQGQTQTGTTNQTQATTGTSTGSTSGTTTQNTQGTTGVVDTLGFGDLLKSQAGTAGANDETRNAYLTDLVKTGGDQFNNQVDAAVRQSVSGPSMQGVGDSAMSRAAGYAAANVARNNQDQRLAAASQLAGPSATTTLAGAGNPYLGSTNSNTSTGTNTASSTQSTNQNTTGTTDSNSSMSGFSDLLSKQNSSGTSDANNRQVAYGNAPEQKSSGGGGSVICTALGERGLLPNWMLVDELAHVKSNWPKFKRAAKGYFTYGVPIAKLVRRSALVAYATLPLARFCAYEASRRIKPNTLPFFLTPWLAYQTFYWVNTAIGCFVPGEPEVRDPEIKKMLEDRGLDLNSF